MGLREGTSFPPVKFLKQNGLPFADPCSSQARLSVARSAAVGTAALINGHLDLTALTQEVNEDLEQLESTMNRLQDQMDSLAEMVLQNYRGLDLLFMSKGEDGRLYANQFGIVRSSLAKVKENIQHRNKTLENRKSWSQGWFEWNPWLTTLLTGLAGPVALLLLGLLLGHCILNWLINFY